MTTKIGVISLGCAKALIDSEKIITKLLRKGYLIVGDYNEADLVIINTCGFINEAINESLSTIEEALTKHNKVIVIGCLGVNKQLILEKYPNVLHICGPNDYAAVLEAVQQHSEIPQQTNFIPEPGIKLTPAHYAYLKIAEGCDNHCSFCIIPQLRGKLISYSSAEILTEAQQLAKRGVKELLLIAQDTTAYGKDLGQANLVVLLEQLAKLDIWIRLHYLYPGPIIDSVVKLMADGKLLPYLDMPLQHINPRILKLMQRPGYQENLLEHIQKWRKICPDLAIRSTFIVGFPGEKEQEFKELLEFLKVAHLDRVGCFKYSPVAGATANKLPNLVPEDIKQQRFDALMQLQAKISATKLASRVGQTTTVIVDKIVNNQAIARSIWDAPEVDGRVIIEKASHLRSGDVVVVLINNSETYDLYAELP